MSLSFKAKSLFRAIGAVLWDGGSVLLKWGFTGTFPVNKDATLKLKSELISPVYLAVNLAMLQIFSKCQTFSIFF